jgi:hypothetical protein
MLDYQAPPICEGDFTSTGVSTISLQPILRPQGPTGLVMSWDGTRWRLDWNIVPGALCYSVYRLNDVLDPFSEWILVAECVAGNTIKLDPGIYGVTVITLDGESPPSEPIEGDPVDPADPPPVIPDPPAECPDESGVETPFDLAIPAGTPMGTIVPNPAADGTAITWFSEESPGPGRYGITYDGGAWKDETNPYPDQFKLVGIRFVYDGEGDIQDPFLGNSTGKDTQAEVEAWAAVNILANPLEFFNNGEGGIGVQYIRGGAPDEPVSGAPNPTWSLTLVETYPTFPARLRIQGYSESIWESEDGCSAVAAGLPSWSGSFDWQTYSIPWWFWWRSTEENSTTIQGKQLAYCELAHWGSNPATVTGAGWRIQLNFVNGGGLVDAWTGVKNVGADPIGRYYRQSGCLSAPGCVTIEAY